MLSGQQLHADLSLKKGVNNAFSKHFGILRLPETWITWWAVWRILMFCIGCFLQSSHVLTAVSYLAHTHSSLTFSEIENTHTAYSSNSEEKLIHLSVITLQTLSPLGWKVLYVWNLNGLKNFLKKKKKKKKNHIRQKCDVVIDFTGRLQIQKDNKSKVWAAVSPWR